jgi:endonuclease YncB( thermonuclease family)
MRLLAAILVATLSYPAVAAANYLGKVTAVADGDTFTMESKTGRVRVRI